MTTGFYTEGHSSSKVSIILPSRNGSRHLYILTSYVCPLQFLTLQGRCGALPLASIIAVSDMLIFSKCQCLLFDIYFSDLIKLLMTIKLSCVVWNSGKELWIRTDRNFSEERIQILTWEPSDTDLISQSLGFLVVSLAQQVCKWAHTLIPSAPFGEV